MGGGGMPGGPWYWRIMSIIDFSLGIWLSMVSARARPNLYITKIPMAKKVTSATCLGFTVFNCLSICSLSLESALGLEKPAEVPLFA